MEAFEKLEKMIAHRELHSKKISDWTVGMQIEHALRSHIGIIKVLRKSLPGEEKQDFNLKRKAILLSGRFPRGVAKAPKRSAPTEGVNEAQIRKLLAMAKSEHQNTDSIENTAWFKHGMLGIMNKATSLKFSEIHVNHHVRIAKEIIADNG